MQKKGKILIVDDEKIALRNLEHIMKKDGYEVIGTLSGQNALKLLEEHNFDTILTDLKMPKVDGMQILNRCRELSPDTEVVMITGYATLKSAIEAMKHGAFYYIAKPFKLDEVRKIVQEAVEKGRLKEENRQLREQIEKFHGKVKIITQDAHMQRLLDTSLQIATTDCNILISGESGTGKELLARYIHFNSKRSERPFFAINCGAFTQELLANELFGHEKGAFTGADRRAIGKFEFAAGGTIFLDEIGDLPFEAQAKLLRAL